MREELQMHKAARSGAQVRFGKVLKFFSCVKNIDLDV
jgi:hypothetical protein